MSKTTAPPQRFNARMVARLRAEVAGHDHAEELLALLVHVKIDGPERFVPAELDMPAAECRALTQRAVKRLGEDEAFNRTFHKLNRRNSRF